MKSDRNALRWTRRIAAQAGIACIALTSLLGAGVRAIGQSPASPDASSQAPGSDAQDPPSRVARLAQIQGQVSVEPAGVDQWTQAADNYPLTTGDRLYADQDGQAELQMEQAAVRVWHRTDLSVTNLTDSLTQLGLSQGSLHVRTNQLPQGTTVEIDTPNGAIDVLEPGDFRVDCYTADGGTVVSVDSGQVQITGPNFSQTLAAGQSMRLVGDNPITATALAMPGRDAFDAWSEQRDQQWMNAQSNQYVNPDTVGAEDLDQYGSWGNDPADGPVWYPNGVPVGWVPYSTGRWVWVSPWGWTWVDTYPWGFAPFHYGRWAYFGSRWGWVPGPYGYAPVYSPALVGFVGGASFSIGGVGLSAWFPLGPGEPYYPWYHCTPGYFTQVNITNIHRVTINRTNYYNYYHNQAVFHRIQYVNRRTGTIAVRANEFAGGRPITPHTAIRLNAQQLAHAQIIPHPFVNPTRSSVVPHPVTSVPQSAQRPMLMTTRGELHPAPGGHGTMPSQGNRPQPMPSSAMSRPMTPQRTPETRTNPAQPIHANPAQPLHNNIAPRSPVNLEQSHPPDRTLISRTPPPAPRPTFEERQPAYNRDPGRPLGPQQVNNLMQGRPAGQPRSPEFPPHPAWAPRPAAPAPREQMRGGAPRR
jgi:hypothetical protein